MAGAPKQANSAGTDCPCSPHVFFGYPVVADERWDELLVELRVAVSAGETLRHLVPGHAGIVCLADCLAQRLAGGPLDD